MPSPSPTPDPRSPGLQAGRPSPVQSSSHKRLPRLGSFPRTTSATPQHSTAQPRSGLFSSAALSSTVPSRRGNLHPGILPIRYIVLMQAMLQMVRLLGKNHVPIPADVLTVQTPLTLMPKTYADRDRVYPEIRISLHNRQIPLQHATRHGRNRLRQLCKCRLTVPTASPKFLHQHNQSINQSSSWNQTSRTACRNRTKVAGPAGGRTGQDRTGQALAVPGSFPQNSWRDGLQNDPLDTLPQAWSGLL